MKERREEECYLSFSNVQKDWGLIEPTVTTVYVWKSKKELQWDDLN